MKKAVLYILIIPILIGDVFQELGSTSEEGKSQFFNAIVENSMGFPSGARKIAMDQRPRVVKTLGEFFKIYYKSDDFKKRYISWWKEQEPSKPESPQARLIREKKELEKQKSEAEKNALEAEKQMRKQINETKDPTLKKQFQEILATMLEVKKQIKEQQNNANWNDQLKEMEVSQKLAFEEEYKEKEAKYKKDYNRWQAIQNPDVLLKEKLELFLTKTSDINFSAKTKTSNGKTVFADPAFEQKDQFWKLCFRAGKPTLDLSRQTASQWLNEIKR